MVIQHQQTSKVYAFTDWALNADELVSGILLDDAQELIDFIWCDTKQVGDAPILRKDKNTQKILEKMGAMGLCMDNQIAVKIYGDQIPLAPLLHELAHAIVQDGTEEKPEHCPEWVGVFVALIKRFMAQNRGAKRVVETQVKKFKVSIRD